MCSATVKMSSTVIVMSVKTTVMVIVLTTERATTPKRLVAHTRVTKSIGGWQRRLGCAGARR